MTTLSFMLAGSSHTCVRACWIIARPCPCPVDHRTPVSVPGGSSHARVCAQWIIARPCLLDARARWIPTHARPCPLDPRTPVPAGSPRMPVCARWIPARPCLLDFRTPVPAGSPHTHARWIPTHARVCAHRIPTPARVRARWIPTHARTHTSTHPPGPCTHAGCARTALTALTRMVPMPARSWGPHALTQCPHTRVRHIPCTHICICWMCHVCIPELYVVMGGGLL